MEEKIRGLEILESLALNLRWSWYHGGDKVWRTLDPELWSLTHNPWIVLQTISREKLETALGNADFRKIVDALAETNKNESNNPAWFQKTHEGSPLTCIAYFSMEYMLSEGLPIYSGGLGNVAGDQLKAASDLGLPVIAIGLLYQQGYFRQMIDKNGAQQAHYPFNDPGQLPIKPLRKENGEWLRLEIAMPGYTVWIRAWEVHVGRVKLYLLDSNDPANFPPYRAITSELYGGGQDTRLKQEIILGIGGWRLLEALGIQPEVCHLNEGHAAFAVLERAFCFMKKTGVSFEIALAATRAGNLFTTHTAVPAGFDRFPPEMISSFLGNYAEKKLKISMKNLLALGRINPDDSQEQFNMAFLAMRGSGFANGVSKLHGKVSRHIFAPLFPKWPESEIPIGSVTNGVHMPSWDFEDSDELWTDYCGKSRWLESTEVLESFINKIPEEKIWKMRQAGRQSFIEFTRKRLSLQYAVSGEPQDEVEKAKSIFDPSILTLGFARRFATYKRPNMLLSDPERLVKILTNSERPVQLVIAGKAHPADLPGQALIQQWNQFIKDHRVKGRVVFLSDYNMLLTEQLVKGVDVWINTPRRPWEACGTSGMKVLVNGVLNMSELDGWWAEAYSPEVGWAIGDGKEHGDDPTWDKADAGSLYDLLENHIIPLFYQRDSQGFPSDWIRMIRNSMAKLTPKYSSNRTVREYTEQYYIPAATNYRKRTADAALLSMKIVEYENKLKREWSSNKFGALKIETNGDKHKFEVEAFVNTNDVKVELYIDSINGGNPRFYEMTLEKRDPISQACIYNAYVPSERPASHYTARIVPKSEDLSIPLEANEILWQH